MKAMNKIAGALSAIGFCVLAVTLIFPEFNAGAMGVTMAVSGVFSPKFTFTDKQIESFSELIYEDVFKKDALNTYFTFVEGIKAKKKIGIVGEMTEIGRAKGSCSTTETEVSIATAEKTWDPVSWGDRIPFCAANLEDQFYIWGMNNGIERSDLTNTDYADFILSKVKNGMLESLYRIVFFGDKIAENTNATPPGQITAGKDKTLFTVNNGLWQQVFAIVAATPARRIAISRNTQASYAAQAFDGTDITNAVATNLFRDMIQKSHRKGRTTEGRFILCTQSLADQYSNELESKTGIPPSWERIENGTMKLRRMGVEIVVLPYWDEILETYFNDGAKIYLPHRAIMYSKDNATIGTESTSSLEDLEMFYDKKSKNNYVDFLSSFDIKIVQDKLIQAAY